jgi:hypothetical protein
MIAIIPEVRRSRAGSTSGGARRGAGEAMTHPIEEQHRRLAVLFEDTRAAFGGGEAGLVRARFERLREALDAHFDQEDRLYYPPIAALRPAHRATVTAIGEAHRWFRQRFGEIAAALDGGSLAAARRAFEEFVDAFAKHEVIEEELVRSLESEVAAVREG